MNSKFLYIYSEEGILKKITCGTSAQNEIQNRLLNLFKKNIQTNNTA